MRAVVCHEFGPPEQLVVDEVDDPRPASGELLVRVAASAVTFPDTLMLEDKYQFKPTPPYIPGGEVTGVVAELGEGVEGWAVGERLVGGLGSVGGFAELATVPAASAGRVPEAVDLAMVAGVNYAYGTGLYGLRHRAALRAGETLLVLGAGGSVGLAAVELGRLFGARVIAAASNNEKLELSRRHGADATIDYTTEDLKSRVKELTDGQGVDVVYDCVGGERAEQALRAIAWEGRFLVVGFAAGIPSIPLNLALLKGCQIIGVFYGAMTRRDPAWARSIVDELIGLVATGALRPHISGRYPLERASEALRLLSDRKAIGKLVITP